MKVGDKVRLLNLKGCVVGFKVGDICKIIDTESNGFYNIQIENEGCRGFVNESMIKPIFYKKGDYVVVDRSTTIEQLDRNNSEGCRTDTFTFLEQEKHRGYPVHKIIERCGNNSYRLEGYGVIVNGICLKPAKIKKMTKKEIEKELGYEVEIIDD